MAAALYCSSCTFQTYEPDPIRAEDFAHESADRATAGFDPGVETTGRLTLALAASWMRERSPRVREALADYAAAAAQADVGTPWPNPEIAVGPQFAFGPDVDQDQVVPFGSLSATIPLSGRLARQDDLNEASARAAFAGALATLREQFLELRSRFVRLAVARQRVRLREEVLNAASDSLRATDEMVAAGTATAFDVALFRLEEARERSRLVTSELAAASAGSDLSELVAVPATRLGELPEDALPQLPEAVPTMAALQDLVVGEHANLLRLRARHEVAERRLHLEITKQYPDLQIGTQLGGEPGERQTRLGLTLGISLPIFDRNQQEIAVAVKEREAARVRYFSAIQDILTAVERAGAALDLEVEHHRILREEVLPAAEANLEIAEASVEAGSAGALELLDAQRSLRQVRIEVLEARLAEQLAWASLEQAVGYPIVKFTPDTDTGAWNLSADGAHAGAEDGEGR